MNRALLLLPLLLAGCDDQSMTQQKRYDTYAASTLWANGSAAQPLPAGVVARDAAAPDAPPPPLDPAVMRNGQQQYDIFCSPCHGRSGDGNGIVVQRGFPRPAPLDSPALRAASAQHLFKVIGEGSGVMYPFASRIAPADRWAIVAYIRALQLSQRAALASVPDAGEQLR